MLILFIYFNKDFFYVNFYHLFHVDQEKPVCLLIKKLKTPFQNVNLFFKNKLFHCIFLRIWFKRKKNWLKSFYNSLLFAKYTFLKPLINIDKNKIFSKNKINSLSFLFLLQTTIINIKRFLMSRKKVTLKKTSKKNKKKQTIFSLLFSTGYDKVVAWPKHISLLFSSMIFFYIYRCFMIVVNVNFPSFFFILINFYLLRFVKVSLCQRLWKLCSKF